MPPDATDQQGLSQAEAARRLAADGPNELPQSRPRSALRQLRGVVAEPMFLLLVACGGIYLVLGDRAEALMLLGFVFIVMAISFVQQRRSERSLDALRDLSSPRALVLRDGVAQRVAGRELVEGDIVLLAEGDRVPADMALLDASNLTIDESMLTGESQPVAKQLPLADDDNTGPPLPSTTQAAPASPAVHAYAGTLVTQGMGRGRVSATGERSALGQIGKSLAALGGEQTPTQLQTAQIVRRVAAIGLALAAALALGWWVLLGDWLNGLLAGLTLAMAILPEELPVVLTLFLGLGAWRLSREKVLARSIPAIELLGATTVLCVDKTGTLTANRMALRRLWSEQAAYDCAADAAAPLQEELHGVLEYAVLASHRRAYDPMESAIGDAGQRLLANTEHLHADWTLVNDYPLSREMLAMSRVWQSPDRRELMIAAKGAPEAVVDLCHMDPARAAAIAAQVEALARDGLRVLGVACATFSASELPGNQHDFDFDFLGLVALEDPIRPDVAGAIAECRAAGIRVVMITGDHPATALSIARQAGLPVDGAAMTGAELAALDDATLRARLPATQVFCRVQPEQKLRLVQAFRAAGEVVAMTGDGVNDAPALKAAHIGVAMGAHGTDVAREAAALVLLNDDFSSLVTAVRYGRRVFANLRKAIVFVVAVHVPIVGLSLLPLLFGWPMLLMPVHIMFLQLIIDPACSVVFEAEEIEAGAMAAPPRPPEARLFDRAVLVRGLWQGGGLLATLVGVYALARWHSGSDQVARALAFSVLVLSNLGLIQANRVWARGAGWGRGGQAGRYFGAIALATCALLAAALGLPALGQLFGFVRPDAALLLAGAAVVGLNLLWFEAVKRVLTRAERAS
ncbi:ATPase [Janthinobacterium sp. BJB412]|nr:ATPase [Janthinobacterium sp. BJB412]